MVIFEVYTTPVHGIVLPSIGPTPSIWTGFPLMLLQNLQNPFLSEARAVLSADLNRDSPTFRDAPLESKV